MQTSLHLSKQNFKFSAAHFLIFNEKHAERLHGHNYQVKVDLAFSKKSDQGYLVDFNILKKEIKARLEQWDEYVLLPKLHPDMKISVSGKSTEVRFRDRYYVFPSNEVILLETNNTSVENFSQMLLHDFAMSFKKHGIAKLRVTVEESRGQSASCTIEL